MHETSIEPGGKRWAVLGDIFELGQYAAAEHRTCGAGLPATIDYLIAIGDEARYYVEGALNAGMPAQHIFSFRANVEDSRELEAAKQAAAALLKQRVHPSDLVLIKGSRGMRMETMLPLLAE